MKRSEHFNVVAGKWLNGYSLSVNGRKYAIYGNDNTSDNIEVGDVSVTFHFDDGETFLDSLIVSGSECKKGRIDVEDYLRE